MTGDLADMLARLRAVLPARFFPDSAPVLDGLLTGLSWGWSCLYGLLEYAGKQTRIATATDVWLDMIACDFFGRRLSRHSREADAEFSMRIRRELLRERGTRAALISVLTDLTGRTPTVFEPACAADTGGWGLALGYGMAGGWGSLSLPFQCFVTAYRPHGTGISSVSGWGDVSGGYGIGATEYASLAMVTGQVTDMDINVAIADTLPVAAIAWTRITN